MFIKKLFFLIKNIKLNNNFFIINIIFKNRLNIFYKFFNNKYYKIIFIYNYLKTNSNNNFFKYLKKNILYFNIFNLYSFYINL